MTAETALAMKRLRVALERRIRQDDRCETKAATKRKAEGGLAAFDTRALAQVLRPALEWDGRGWAALAAEIGVTSPDLSRVMAGQDISAGKVFAICDWLRVEPRKFYRPKRGERKCFTGRALKRSFASRRAAAPAGRPADGGQSAAELSSASRPEGPPAGVRSTGRDKRLDPESDGAPSGAAAGAGEGGA